MITDEQIGRLGRVLGEAARVGGQAIGAYGRAAQQDMAAEEAGELVSAIMHRRRDRVSASVVIDETADVIITALQVAMIESADGSLDELITAIATKTARLYERVDKERFFDARKERDHG